LVSSPGSARRALTRTSVGNEKYEYERKKRDAARANATTDRYDPVVQGPAAGAVAVRHDSTLTDAFGSVNRFFGIWRGIGAIPHQTLVRKARRPDGFARMVAIATIFRPRLLFTLCTFVSFVVRLAFDLRYAYGSFSTIVSSRSAPVATSAICVSASSSTERK